MDGGGHQTNLNDERVTAEAGSHQSIVRLNVVGMDKPFFTALAIVLSLSSAFYAWQVSVEEQRKVYWEQRTEAFIEQLSAQGVKVPQDILDHIKRKEK